MLRKGSIQNMAIVELTLFFHFTHTAIKIRQLKRGNYPVIRLPLGISSEQAHEKINTYVTNFSTFTGVSTNDVSSYNLVEVPNRDGSLMYVDAKGRPLLYGYTNKAGDDLTPNKTATNTIPIPFIIDLTGNQKGNVNTKLKDKLLPQTKETMDQTAQELAKEREYRTKYVGK